MGIDISAQWPDATEIDDEESTAWNAMLDRPSVANLREAYHGGPYPSQHLVREAFAAPAQAGSPIRAATLRRRLPITLRLAEERATKVYGLSDPADIQKELKQYTRFVMLCESLERQFGEPATIFCSQ